MHSDRSHLTVGLPHSEIRGSQPSYRLLSAYRRFSRPSSPLNAKASITCPFSLGHAYLTPAGGRCMPRRTLRIRQSVTRRTTHAHRRLNTRDRFSVQFNTCTASRSSSPAEARKAYVSGVHDQHFTCQRCPHADANGDRQWYRGSRWRQGG